jgi:hypothetical protein
MLCSILWIKSIDLQDEWTLQAYLREKGQTKNFENLSKTDLYMILNKFYTEARQENGQMYKKPSMFALRHDLNRYSSCKSIDLIQRIEQSIPAIIKELICCVGILLMFFLLAHNFLRTHIQAPMHQ